MTSAAPHDLGRTVADADDCVGSQLFRLIHHPFHRDLPGLVEHFRVAHDLAAHQRLHGCHKVFSEVFGMDDRSFYHAQGLKFYAWDVFNT